MKLQDVCCFIVDCPHSTAPDEGCGIPLIRTPNIGYGRFNLEGVHRVAEKVYQARCARAIPQNDDIIFAREAPAGNAAIIKNNEKMCLGQRTVLIRPNPEKVCPDFLVYYLLAPEQQYKLLGTANGATVAHVNLPTIREMNVDNLPPLEIQRKIADVLSAYDDLIENNRKQIKLLEEAARRLYKEWFIDLRFPDYETTPIIDGIPSGWEMNSLSSIIKLRSGFAFKSKDFCADGNFNIVTIKNVQDGVFDAKNTDAIAEIPANMPKHCVLSNGDILLSLTGNIGRVCFVVGQNFLLNQRVAKIESKYHCFAYCLFRNKDFCDTLNNLANGAAQQNLSPVRTEQMSVLIPPASLLSKFEKIASLFFKKLQLSYESNNNLQKARDKILPKLMTGELEVNA